MERIFVNAAIKFRIFLDTNKYSVPAEYASAPPTLKVYPDHLCVYHQDKLIVRHQRRYDRHQDIENPDHPRELLQQRRRASDQKLLMRLLALTPKAEAFYRELQQRRLNAPLHVRRIVALSVAAIDLSRLPGRVYFIIGLSRTILNN